MIQGEVWTLADGARVLIASNNRYNEQADAPVVVPLVRDRRWPVSELMVRTISTDNVSGVFVLPLVGQVSLLGGKTDGLISGPTMAAVSTGLARLFAH